VEAAMATNFWCFLMGVIAPASGMIWVALR
jgi:hypothetical protein